jgi:type I restriction enzyme, S subunit
MIQQLLTARTRLQGFRGEWVSVRLSDIADRYQRYSFVGGPFGSSLKVSDYTPTGVRILQLQNIGDGVFHLGFRTSRRVGSSGCLRVEEFFRGGRDQPRW